MSKNVNLQVLYMRGDFDARNKVHTDLVGFCRRYRKTLQGVVIGHSQNRDIAVLGEAYQLLRREDAVRSSRMGVQIDQGHRVIAAAYTWDRLPEVTRCESTRSG